MKAYAFFEHFYFIKFVDDNTKDELFTIRADIDAASLREILYVAHISEKQFDVVIQHGVHDGVILAADIPFDKLVMTMKIIKNQINSLDDLRRVIVKYTSLDIKEELRYKWYD